MDTFKEQITTSQEKTSNNTKLTFMIEPNIRMIVADYLQWLSNITAEWNPTKGAKPLQLYAHFGPSTEYSSIMKHYLELYGGVGCGCDGGCDIKKVSEDSTIKVINLQRQSIQVKAGYKESFCFHMAVV